MIKATYPIYVLKFAFPGQRPMEHAWITEPSHEQAMEWLSKKVGDLPALDPRWKITRTTQNVDVVGSDDGDTSMKTYKVRLRTAAYQTITVEAMDEDEAETKAMDEADWGSWDIDEDEVETDDIELQEAAA